MSTPDNELFKERSELEIVEKQFGAKGIGYLYLAAEKENNTNLIQQLNEYGYNRELCVTAYGLKETNSKLPEIVNQSQIKDNIAKDAPSFFGPDALSMPSLDKGNNGPEHG
ncbi:hypothetical protein L3V82_00260 [Thiotrichales bacterium 19S3-7]|nr:hypothetical protein [Thiotrichales bacterium 19S3-7]MCF6800596.1 hypothetical protein [Thiotrichales bacterium 19S3-11]